MAFGEFGATLLVVAAGGGLAIGLAIGIGDLTPGMLVVGDGFDAPDDWALDVAIVVALGLPLARAMVLRRAPSWILDLEKRAAVSAVLLTAVAVLVGVWTGLDLVDASGQGPDWQRVAALTALIAPPLVCLGYLLLHRAWDRP